ncbi:MAG: hypothetical protein UT61_C0054G0013, partial [Candidatus Woesebacteria bacterium GW2011_GWA1_39_8]
MQYNDEKNPPSLKASGGQREKLNRLEKKLYSRGAPNIIDAGRTELKEDVKQNEEIKTDWPNVKTSSFDELAAKMSKVAQNKHNFVNKIFIASLVFFVVAAGIAAFVFLGGSNLVSSRNVDVQVSGPLSIPGGQEVSFDIDVVNNNNVDLNAASLLVEYPEGVRSPLDFSKELGRERFDLGTIKSKESRRQNIKAVFFG